MKGVKLSFRTRRVIISSPFYAILNILIFYYIFSLFGEINYLGLSLIVLSLWIIRVIPMFFEEKESTRLGRFLSTIDGVWIWFMIMMIIYIAVISIINYFIPVPTIYVKLIFLTIPIIGVYSYINAHRIKIKEKTLQIDNISREYNVAHLSDVHFGSIRHKDIIKDLTDKLIELSDYCDLVFISGDLADGSCAVKEDDLIELKKVDIPIIFTSGNHDYYPGVDNVHKACKKAGIIILENSGMEYEDLNIYGLSYSFDKIPMPSEKELHDFIKTDKVNIVNYHIPNGWDKLLEIGFKIQLSGHTHGGQFYPVTWLGNLVYEGHNMGLFEKEVNQTKNYLHVTTGLGSMDMPMRWGTNSEIVILKLRKLNNKNQ